MSQGVTKVCNLSDWCCLNPYFARFWILNTVQVPSSAIVKIGARTLNYSVLAIFFSIVFLKKVVPMWSPPCQNADLQFFLRDLENNMRFSPHSLSESFNKAINASVLSFLA